MNDALIIALLTLGLWLVLLMPTIDVPGRAYHSLLPPPITAQARTTDASVTGTNLPTLSGASARRSHVYVGSLHIADVEAETLYFVQRTPAGDAHVALGMDEEVVRCDFGPFGQPLSTHPGHDCLYAEKPLEASGWSYFDARYYASPVARFASPDPVLSTAVYAYSQNPFRYHDWTGRELELVGAPSERMRLLHDLRQLIGTTPVVRIQDGRYFVHLDPTQPRSRPAGALLVSGLVAHPETVQLRISNPDSPPRLTLDVWNLVSAAHDTTTMVLDDSFLHVFLPAVIRSGTQLEDGTPITFHAASLSGTHEVHVTGHGQWMLLSPPPRGLGASDSAEPTVLWAASHFVLAHELGHALLYLQGDPRYGEPQLPQQDAWSPENPLAHGGGVYWENRIRLEHGAPLRPRY